MAGEEISMVGIITKHDPPIVFPPIDHENLHIPLNHPKLFSDSDSDSDSSSFSPSDSTLSPPAQRLHSWSEMFKSKLNGFFCSVFPSSFFTFRSAAFTAVLVAFLYFRRRRRLEERSRDRLIGIITQTDEKINQLLDQISQMNQVLVSLHKVPTSTTS